MQLVANVKDFLSKAQTSWKSLSVHQRTSTLATVFVMLLVPAAILLAQSPIKLRNQAASPVTLPGSETPTPTQGHTIEAQPETTEIDFDFQKKNPQHSMVIDAILRYNGNFVYDQADFEYTWSIADGSIVTGTLNNDCRPGTIEPCPYERLVVQGLKLGTTTTKAVIKRKSTGEEIGTAAFTIKVVGTITSTPTPTPTPTSNPTPTQIPTTTTPPTLIPTAPAGKAPTIAPAPKAKSSPPKPTARPIAPAKPAPVIPAAKPQFNLNFGWLLGVGSGLKAPKKITVTCRNELYISGYRWFFVRRVPILGVRRVCK